MLTETAKIEAYITERLDGRIHATYGCSLGGSFVGLLVQRGNIRIDYAMLGSSDLDQETGRTAQLKSGIMAGMPGNILHAGKLPGWMQRRIARRPQKSGNTPKNSSGCLPETAVWLS